jgi:hypothetical protein
LGYQKGKISLLMDQSKPTFTIDLNQFIAQLQQDLMTDLTALRVVLKSIKDNDYPNIKIYSPDNSFQNWAINPLPEPEVLRVRQITDCFKAVMGSLHDCIDKLVATIRLCELTRNENVFVADKPLTLEGVQEFISKKFLEILENISRDQSLKVPEKLEILSIDDDLKQILQNYFGIRNGFEHHKGISNKDRVTTFKKMSFVADSGKEIREIIGPGVLNAGEGISVRFVDEEISFKEGDVMN